MALEFAMVAPMLFLLIFATLQFGLHYWAASTARATAREAARLMVVNTDWSCTRRWVLGQLGQPGLGATETATLTNALTGAALNTSTTIPEGTVVRVTVTLDTLDLRLGFLPSGHIVRHADALVQYQPVPVGSAPQPCPVDYQ